MVNLDPKPLKEATKIAHAVRSLGGRDRPDTDTLLDANKACARLTHACQKEARRLRGENPTPCTAEECKAAIMEEMADVALCLDMLDNSDYVLDPIIAKAKLDRWSRRLDDAGK